MITITSAANTNNSTITWVSGEPFEEPPPAGALVPAVPRPPQSGPGQVREEIDA